YRLRPATCDGCPTVGEVHDSAGRTCARSRHANNGREGYQLPSCRWVWIGGDRGACTGLVDGLCLCCVRQGGRTCRLVRRNRRPTGDRVFEEEICTAIHPRIIKGTYSLELCHYLDRRWHGSA